jgi:hypothetical protein
MKDSAHHFLGGVWLFSCPKYAMSKTNPPTLRSMMDAVRTLVATNTLPDTTIKIPHTDL